MLFDTHAHLDQDDFDGIREEVLERAAAAEVTGMVTVGTTLAASEKCVELAAAHGSLYAAVAIHPNYVAASQPGDWAAIEQLSTASRVVAIGETGLDRHWDYSPFEMQQEYFARHIDLAYRRDLPFIVHMRDCEADILDMLRDASRRAPLRGIMHSFTGDADMAAECVAMGLHISFAGMITYKKSQALRECAAGVPAERLLIETDSPYLSPEPVRGQRPNEPANLRHTAQCVAQARGMTLENLARLTSQNARELFRIAG